MHVDQIKSRTVRVQLAAAALGACAVAAAIVPVAAPSVEEVAVPEVKAPENKGPLITAAPTGDIAELARSLDSISPPVIVPKKVETAAAPPVPVEPPPPAWRYLGSLVTPAGLRGLVSVDNRQVLIRKDDRVNDATVTELTTTYLVLTRGDKTERIDLAPRASGALKVITPGQAGMAGPNAAQLAAQNAAQAEAAKRFMEQAAKDPGRLDGVMARIERIDMMEKSGRISPEMAEKARSIAKEGNVDDFQSFMKNEGLNGDKGDQ